MVKISEEEINAVRDRADITEIIGHYLPVTKKGKSYVALCPFHDDHDPSMTISPDKQIYKCFVCGSGGNVFSFVQNYEKIPYIEAVGKVAEMIGFPLSVSIDRYEPPKDPVKESLYRVMEEAIAFTMYQMDASEAQEVRAYCDRRGLTSDVRSFFGIGYNPGNDILYRFLQAKNYADADIVSCNLARTSMSGLHDVFGGRITFPIHDEKGRPIGFSARTTDPENPSKYINTTDTELFHKGNIVYNLHRARLAARRENCIYVCEGVTDVIAFYRAGIENCVCTLGTACTEYQIRLLKNAASRIVFCYDGDDAGQAATWKACKLAQKLGCRIAVVRNKTKKDPDELLREGGAQALKDMVSNQQAWMEFALDYLSRRTNFNNYEDRKEFVRQAQAEIALLPDEFDRRNFTMELAKISGFDLRYQPVRKRSRNAALPEWRIRYRDGKRLAQEQILAMMMSDPHAMERFVNDLGYLPDQDCNAAAMMIIDMYRQSDEINPAALLDRTERQSVKDLIVSVLNSGFADIPYDENMMDGLIGRTRRAMLEERKELMTEQKPVSAEGLKKFSEEYTAYLRKISQNIQEDNGSSGEGRK